jgi:UDP-glucose 4-epimerase
VSRTIVVFGATSYVGSWSIRALLEAGYDIVGVSRRPAIASILLHDVADRIALVSPEEAQRHSRGAFAVLNYAYVQDARIEDVYRQNLELIDTVIETAVTSGAERVVHTSTVAVFGYDLLLPPQPVRVRWRPIDPYVESKIVAEHRLAKKAREAGRLLAIVRLGNVIGPGSPLWTAEVAQRILEDKPIGYQGHEGFSNATYVENVADYLAFLLDVPAPTLAAFGEFHHLAEFARHRWTEVLDPIAAAMDADGGLTLAAAPSLTGTDGSTLGALRQRASKGRAGGYLRAAFGVAGQWSWARKAVALGRAAVKDVTRPLPLAPEDEAFLQIMSVSREFSSHVVSPWQPKVDFDEARRQIREWVASAGYGLRLQEGSEAPPST